MPCSTNVPTADTYTDVIQSLVQLTSNSAYDFIVIGGDFNCCLANTAQGPAKDISDFVEQENLFCVSNAMHSCTIDYTFESKANGAQIFIDHFIVSKNLQECIETHYVCNDIENPSDHLPLFLHINVSGNIKHKELTSVTKVPKVCWYKATPRDICDYKSLLDHNLEHVHIPWDAVHCSNSFCTVHYNDIQLLYEDIVKTCIDATLTSCQGLTNIRQKKKPGWNDVVRDLHQKALFWHSLWESSGSPVVGIVADLRRSTRPKYHKSVKLLKKQKDNIATDNLAQELLNNDYTNFWKDIKNLNHKTNELPHSINNISRDSNIAELFKGKYCDLYNSVSSSQEEMKSITLNIRQGISTCCSVNNCYHNHAINVNCVKKCIQSLKKNKDDGTCNITTDHIINGSEKLIFLSILFSCMLILGFSPKGFLESQIIPIPKSKRKFVNDMSNYRGIAMSSVLGKVLDSVIISLHKNVLGTCDMQYRFKQKHSTTQCTAIVKEIVGYYKNMSLSVYLLMLDASQAFDRVNYKKLFTILLNRGMCFLTVRLLLYIYNNQLVSIRWGNSLSTKFTVSNGVKQGGVL